ncbi:hypothetical protein [Methyloceanibacter sp.]|uniref:hypothetical protein n=1 Tax=Methyloceanibacter sp. TaxID=1965321 RepID=UPI002B5A5449|nr:hypothetical protein [Methyloceanibacter sp.]HML93244.1 hypothetical protein [Methyloceanibacter sp.]
MAEMLPEQRRLIRMFAEICGAQLSAAVKVAREVGYSESEIGREIDAFMSKWRRDWAWLFSSDALDMILADTMDAYRSADKPRGKAH